MRPLAVKRIAHPLQCRRRCRTPKAPRKSVHDTEGRNFANRVVQRIGQIDVPGRTDGDTDRCQEASGEDGAIGTTPDTGRTSHRRDYSSGGYSANRVVGCIRHKYIRSRVNRDTSGMIKSRDTTRPVGATGCAGQSSQSAHDTRRRDFANRVIEGIGDVDVACRVDDDTSRTAEACIASGPIRAAHLPGLPSQSRYSAGGSNFPNRVVVSIAHIEVSCAVQTHANRRRKPCRAPCTIGAPGHSWRPGKSAYHTSGSNFSNCMISRIGNVEVVRTIECDLRGRCKPGGTSGAVGTTGHPRFSGEGAKRVRLIDYLPVESNRKDRLAEKKKSAQRIL